MANKRFYIIDGHAHIFRSYFAPFRDLTSPSGEPTKATFVFTQMMLNLAEQRRPDYLAVVIDHGDETVFRKEIYPAYKSNREPPPADFFPQEKRILEIVRASGVPLFEVPGFEADDIIATMAASLCTRGFDVFMVSKDKDLRQLLNDCVRMYDVQSNEEFDVARMRDKLGYGPEQAIDVQTLMGDKIDNVPGIPGVGEATAVKLLNKYGSVEAILRHVDELTPKMRENFLAHADKLPTSRQLVTLRKDVTFDWDVERCAFRGFDNARLRPLLRELGFWSLEKKLGNDDASGDDRSAQQGTSHPAPAGSRTQPRESGVAPTGGFGGLFDSLEAVPDGGQPDSLQTSRDCDYRLIIDDDQFRSFLKELQKQTCFAFDCETSELGAMRSEVIGLSFSWKEGTGYYIPIRGPKGSSFLSPNEVLPAVKGVLEDAGVGKVGHNIKYDLLAMRCAGITVRGIRLDTMMAAFLLDAGRSSYGIDALARDLLRFQKIPTSDVIGKGAKSISMEKVDLGQVARYASEDADVTWRLYELLSPRLDAAPTLRKLADELETPLIDVLAEMEFNGVAIDPAMLAQQSEKLGIRIEELEGQIHREAGCDFNIDSPKQLAAVLFDKLDLPRGKKTKTGFSTDVQVLENLAAIHPVPKLILEYRQFVKLRNTYLDELPQNINRRTGRIHGSFHMTGAATGRLSMSDPNLQNIPIRTEEGRAIRLAFVAGRPGHELIVADYSQIELRVLAHFTLEPALVEAFANDEDVHAAVAAEVFGVAKAAVTKEQRSQAKVVNFGIIYGITAQGLSRRIDGLTIPAAAELIRAYNQRFPGIEKFMQACVDKARTDGYVETILGRRRPLPDINSGVIALRNGAERAAINSVVQGSAADMIKLAMRNIYRKLTAENRPSKMLLQVHDELIFETPSDAIEQDSALIRHEMINAIPLRVPVRVDIGHGSNWQAGK